MVSSAVSTLIEAGNMHDYTRDERIMKLMRLLWIPFLTETYVRVAVGTASDYELLGAWRGLPIFLSSAQWWNLLQKHQTTKLSFCLDRGRDGTVHRQLHTVLARHALEDPCHVIRGPSLGTASGLRGFHNFGFGSLGLSAGFRSWARVWSLRPPLSRHLLHYHVPNNSGSADSSTSTPKTTNSNSDIAIDGNPNTGSNNSRSSSIKDHSSTGSSSNMQ